MPRNLFSSLPSVSPDHSDADSVVHDVSHSRKRSVSASGADDNEYAQASPKKAKRHAPGTSGYRAQPPVVITAQGHKGLSRKLSFGSVDDDVSISDSVEGGSSLEPAARLFEGKRSRKMSEKAKYMANEVSDGEDEKSQAPVKQIKTPSTKVTLDTPVRSALTSSLKSKGDKSLSAQRQVHAVSVKTEPQSDDDLASPPPSRKAKGKSRALTASPASDENPFLDTPPQKPSRPVPVPKSTTSSKKPSAETPSQKSARPTPVPKVPKVIVKSEPRPREALVSSKKDKRPIRNTSPIEISSDSDDAPVVKTPQKRPSRPVLVTSVERADEESADGEETPRPASKAQVPAPSQRSARRPPRQSQPETPNTPAALTIHTTASAEPSSPAASATGVVGSSSLKFRYIYSFRPMNLSRGPAAAPDDLCCADGQPISLLPNGPANVISGPLSDVILAAAQFKSLGPFFNPANISLDRLQINRYKNLVAPTSQIAICTMLGAVHSCDVINYASSGSYKVKCISIVPYAESMTGFSRFIGSKYSCEEMIAPWEYGSTLTFSTRNEGLTSSLGTSSPAGAASTPASTPSRNMRAFGSAASSKSTNTSLWYEKMWGPFLNFDVNVPIFDASAHPFTFGKGNFTELASLPRYKKYGDPKPADLPKDSIVSVFFSINTYESTRFPPLGDDQGQSSDKPNAEPSTSTVLSLNLQFVVYHGEIPPFDDED